MIWRCLEDKIEEKILTKRTIRVILSIVNLFNVKYMLEVKDKKLEN